MINGLENYIQGHQCPKCNEWLDFSAFFNGYSCKKCCITYGFIIEWMNRK